MQKSRLNRLRLRLSFKGILILTLSLTFLPIVVSYAGVSNTKHDLSASGPGTIKAQAVSEKCVFCHTPHATTDVYPLWNRNLSTATYTVLPAAQPTDTRLTSPGQPDGSSKLCLSCHDGTVAIGLLLNTPGRGTTYPTAISMLGVSGVTPECPAGGCIPTTAGGYIGTDLTNKHLVSIEFDQGLVDQKNNVQCPSGKVSTGLQLPASGDVVKLRPTSHDNGYGQNTGKGIQCRTCHDPHDNANGAFLVKGTPSNYNPLCETCHILCP